LLAVSDLAGSAASLSRNNSGGRRHGDGRHRGALRNGERQTHKESLTLKNCRCKGKNSNVSARETAKESVRSQAQAFDLVNARRKGCKKIQRDVHMEGTWNGVRR